MCISKCFCYFNSQGASSYEFKTFHIRFWRQSHAGTTWGIWEKWKLIECRGFCGASRVKNSVKWCHPRVASPCPKNWQPLTHTKPPVAFPELETMLRKLNLPAKFTTPCQNIGTSHIASRIIIALLHMYQELSKSEEGISNACICVLPLPIKNGAYKCAFAVNYSWGKEYIWLCRSKSFDKRALVLFCFRPQFLQKTITSSPVKINNYDWLCLEVKMALMNLYPQFKWIALFIYSVNI